VAGVTLIRTLAWQSCVGLALCLLGSTAVQGVARKPTVARPVLPPAHGKAIKRTWRNGPATMPPEVEVLPPHSLFPPSVRSRAINSDAGQKAAAGLKAGVPVGASNPRLAVNPSPAVRAGIAAASAARTGMSLTYPEARARDELGCLRSDTTSRRAFYDDLRRSVERVRMGEEDTDPAGKKPIACPANDRPAQSAVE